MVPIASLFADECIRTEIVEHLRLSGVDIISIVDIDPRAKDPMVLREAALRQRVLLTADYDFGELNFRDHLPALGIVIVALNRLRTSMHGPIVLNALEAHRSDLIGGFLNIEPGRTRMRRLDDISR
jgi:predicted nuclease of predicted toxin-antitoxin system